jgi:hypothetical protein
LSKEGSSLPEKLNLNLKKNRVAICIDCQKDAVTKNEKAGASPPPENWNAEIWLCFRLRSSGNCPLGLPMRERLLLGRPID